MDVEKLKKINQLSKEFKRHGMSFEDAMAQAAESVNEKEVKDFLQKSKEETQPAKNPSSAEQYMVLLERNNRKIMEEVQKVKEEIAKIMNEFSEIKSQLEKQKASEETLQKKPEKQTQLETKKKPVNPRQGEYTPEDVAIEKMFYFGKK